MAGCGQAASGDEAGSTAPVAVIDPQQWDFKSREVLAGGGVDAEKPAPEDRSGQSLSTGTHRLQRVCSAAT